MEAKAIARHIRMSSRKVGIVLDLIRGKNVREAEAILKYTPKDAAVVVGKVLKSAVANAEHNCNLDSNRLYVAEAYACQGTTLKRFRPRAQGRAYRIRKRTSHITLVVKERN
ncbi:50S ribosomal protein L22 [Hathewaya histolytica]|uniref:Large ribosomal subunit protein uL22 n=1 Tax=Hathewaya histolytica TaxID=1498 RepID=A0A4U9RVG3_HATHI|nr:50S ribosomal protein L22 [Hathewaya histolytica]VTQ95053.1 ribosomal protein L22, bacterial type [Hathewaya histolytica]